MGIFWLTISEQKYHIPYYIASVVKNQIENREWGQTVNPQILPPVTYFLQQTSTSWRFHNLPNGVTSLGLHNQNH